MTKKLEQELATAVDANRALVQTLHEVAQKHSDIVVVKLIPENSDQFYLDGDFIYDEERAIFKSHKLTNADCVLFKAGKETARRAYEAAMAARDDRIAQLLEENTDLNSRLGVMRSNASAYGAKVQSLESKMSEMSNLMSQKEAAHKSELAELQAANNVIVSDLQRQLESMKTEKIKLEKQYSKMTDGKIITPYGEVREGSK